MKDCAEEGEARDGLVVGPRRMPAVDPRAASAVVLNGPADLLGEEIVRVEPVVLNGQPILVPAALAGCRIADDLREQIATRASTTG